MNKFDDNKKIKTYSTGHLIKRLFSYIKPYKAKFILALILTLFVRLWITAFIIGISNNVIPIPSNPDNKPIIKVSALNIDETFLLDAPIALKIPISLVLSRTEIYVIIPIIIDETTNEIETKAINT